jgi:hypothetical protein
VSHARAPITTQSVAACLALVVALTLLAGCGDDDRSTDAPAPAEAGPPSPQPQPEPTTPPPAAETPAPAAPPPPPATLPLSWTAAGAFIWHETDVDPGLLGRQLRENGFGWAVVFLHDGLVEDPVEADWVRRFREASGLPVGGWGVLRTEPEAEVQLAHGLLAMYGLDFYVADAEAEYEYSGPDGFDPGRFGRSQRFVTTFRSLRPDFPAALSSYCRPDRHDLDWKAWAAAGFAFMPQAYVNDFGPEVAPAACAAAARGSFEPANVHPTIGMYEGQQSAPAAADYVPLLESAGTVGFSVYLAETRMPESEWQLLGRAVTEGGLALSHAPA